MELLYKLKSTRNDTSFRSVYLLSACGKQHKVFDFDE